MIFVSILVLGVLVFVHELGHFLVAKWNRVGVIEFAIGFGPRLLSRRFGDTRYSLRAIPLGGFVRMVGDDPGAVEASRKAEMAPSDSEPAAEESPTAPIDPVEERLLADRSSWFLNKSLSARAAVVIAGPGFNLIFAWILAVASFSIYGLHQALDVPTIGDVMRESPGEKAGLQVGDTIISVDGQSVTTWKEMQELVGNSAGRELLLSIQRPGTTEPLPIRVA